MPLTVGHTQALGTGRSATSVQQRWRQITASGQMAPDELVGADTVVRDRHGHITTNKSNFKRAQVPGDGGVAAGLVESDGKARSAESEAKKWMAEAEAEAAQTEDESEVSVHSAEQAEATTSGGSVGSYSAEVTADVEKSVDVPGSTAPGDSGHQQGNEDFRDALWRMCADGSLEGQRLAVYWGGDDTWYEGKVVQALPDKFKVFYDVRIA